MIQMGKELKNHQIAVLSPEKNEQLALDLYMNISQNITITLQGKNDVHLSGYFEPNNSIEDQLYGAGGLGEEDDESAEEDLEDELAALKQDAKKNGKASDIQGFKKGGDLDKSLKAAKKNAMKNTMNDSDSEDEYGDEESGEDIGNIDLEAEEGEDEELPSDMEDDSEDEVLKEKMSKVTAIKKREEKAKAKKQDSSDDESSEVELKKPA